MDQNPMLFKALREFTTGLFNQLLVNLAGKDHQRWLDEFKKFLRQEPCWVAGVKVYLKHIFETETIVIGATDGTETFASSGIFLGGVYGETPPSEGKPTKETNATVHELVRNGAFFQFLGNIGENRPCWQESQVAKFCCDHHDKLCTEGYATFFELEGSFVAFVYFYDDGLLRVRVSSFSCGRVWFAGSRHRVVSLQQ